MRKSNILPILSIVGVAVTTVLASKAGAKTANDVLKYKQIKSELQPNQPVELKEVRKDYFARIGKAYIPTIIAAGATVVSIIAYQRITSQQLAALASAGAVTAKNFDKYRSKVKQMYGEEADHEIMAEIAKENWEMLPKLPSNDDAQNELFYDEYSERFFYASTDRVQQAMYHLNRNFALRWTASLNEFYEFVGLEPLKGGDDIGWRVDTFVEDGMEPWIDFYTKGYQDSDLGRFHIITYDWPPRPLWVDAEED